MDTGYKTYVSCLAISVIESKRIVVFKRSSNYGSSYIGLNNLEEIYKNLVNYTVIDRSNEDDPSIPISNIPFVCNNVQFDIIIYLNESNIPVGYTEFYNVQGLLGATINIYIEHTTNGGKFITIRVDNSLENLPKRSFIGNKELDYTSIDVAKTCIKRIPKYSKYTNNLYTGNIYLDYGFVNKNKNLLKLPYQINITLDLQNLDEYKTSVEYLNGEFYLYIWNKTKCSIIRENREITLFDIPVYEEKNSFGEIKTRDVEILYGAGKYFVCRIESGVGNFRTILLDTSKFDLRDSNSLKWITNEKDGSVIVDSLDKKEEIIKLNNIISYESFIKDFPEIASTYYDLKKLISEKFFDYISIIIERKLENLYCFRCINHQNEKSYILTNPFFCKELSEEEYRNTLFIDSNTFLIDKGENYSIYNTYYNNEQIFSKTTELYKSPLNNFRRKELSFTDIPHIIGTSRGLIFYIKNNKINYL